MCSITETKESVIKEERCGELRNQEIEIHLLGLGISKTWKMLQNDKRW